MCIRLHIANGDSVLDVLHLRNPIPPNAFNVKHLSTIVREMC